MSEKLAVAEGQPQAGSSPWINNMEMGPVFRLMESLMVPPDKNCSGHNDTPSATQFLNNLEPFQVILIVIGCTCTGIIYFLAVLHWTYVYRYVSIETRRNKLYWLVTLFPVSTGCCLIGMMVPRTSLIMTALGILYYLMCLFVIVSLCRHLFGGRLSFSHSIQTQKIDFRSPPFCCILPWLPQAESTEKNLRRLEWMVLQAPVVRAIIIVCDIVAVAEMREGAKMFLRYSEILSVGSLLLAIFGVHTLARVTSNKLSSYCFLTIFRFVDISLLFFSAQQPMLFQNVLLRFGLIDCGPLLSAQENATFVCNFVIIVEMFVLSVLATILLRPKRNAMFDVFHVMKSTDSFHGTDESMLDDEDICISP